jgi:hypothetical protein
MKKRLFSFSFLFVYQIFIPCFLSAQTGTAVNFKSRDEAKILELMAFVGNTAYQNWQTFHKKIQAYKTDVLSKYRTEHDTLVAKLNRLRDPYYQWRVYVVANGFVGKNFYHDYHIKDPTRNDDTNTCVNGWCQVMSGTGIYPLTQLAEGQINMLKNTVLEEKNKRNPNLSQKKPKYVSVKALLKNIEQWGFLPIDLDLAQRGDICVQYYRKTRIVNEFTAQHVSIVDMIVPWGKGWYELRDWHEGIENEPFVYRTGTNMKSSNNNIFTTENIYYSYQNDLGAERPLTGGNPNICKAYAYFGSKMEEARPLLESLNILRGKIDFWEKVSFDDLNQLFENAKP